MSMKIVDATEIPAGYVQKERMVYILLALFLGGLGVHEFYRGNNQSGGGILALNIISQIWLYAGLACGDIYFFPLLLLLCIFGLNIKMICTEKYDNNGYVMK